MDAGHLHISAAPRRSSQRSRGEKAAADPTKAFDICSVCDGLFKHCALIVLAGNDEYVAIVWNEAPFRCRLGGDGGDYM